MERIKEEELKSVLEEFNNKNLKIEIEGPIKQECCIEDAQILFYDNDIEFEIKNNKNNIILNLAYINEIYFLQKNKLKFLTDIDLEILISFL